MLLSRAANYFTLAMVVLSKRSEGADASEVAFATGEWKMYKLHSGGRGSTSRQRVLKR
ncbi:hypothetical protein K503DRAFT_766864 [Rhizopogon vinicolor AM-OR11-026]|uniref:Uncharacterized protein n=1 Tax=Rhizopogon vinicolor AM-OR11-026 TaxID=1314800 RepID=A0A1B7NBS7_9AGAM|nr:hypothetical protein K503DRAFT_766864 [Rhizopogon vinicolor AM-OR11-026]